MARRRRKKPLTLEQEIRKAYGIYADDVLKDMEKGLTFDEAAENHNNRIERLRMQISK